MLRKTIPLLLTFITGVFAIYLTLFPVPKLEEIASKWVMIITAFSIFLGIVSLLKVNVVKIQKGHRDSFFSFILLIGFFTASILGIVGGTGPQFVPKADKNIKPKTIYVKIGNNPKIQKKIIDKIQLMDNNGKVIGVMTLKEALSKAKTMKTHLVEVNPKADIPVCKLDSNYKSSWKDSFKNKCYYMFTYVIRPMQSTMFSLLAFFVASAAFRAFRVKNFEATVLLISAFLVMLGRVPIGGAIWSGFPVISKWIMETINMAGSRAITFGTAIGIIAVSLKIMLGIERGYLGGSD